MKKSLLALAILTCIGSAAYATPSCSGDCRNSQTGENIANGGEGGSAQSDSYARAQQWQQQQQAQAQALQNTNRINTGDVSNTAQAGAGGAGGTGTGGSASNNGSGNSNVNVVAGGPGSGNVYVDRSRSTAWAPIIHGAGAAPVASASLMAVPGICGFRVDIVQREVKGQRFEQVGRDREFVQGYSEEAVPAKVQFIDYNGYLMGHSVTWVVGALGTSSAGSFSLGLFGKNGEGAQGGASGGSSHQQLVKTAIVQDCVFAAPQPAAAAAIVEVPVIKKGRE